MAEEWITITEAAYRLKVSDTVVRRLLDRDDLDWRWQDTKDRSGEAGGGRRKEINPQSIDALGQRKPGWPKGKSRKVA